MSETKTENFRKKSCAWYQFDDASRLPAAGSFCSKTRPDKAFLHQGIIYFQDLNPNGNLRKNLHP